MPRASYYEDQLITSIKRTCREAVEAGQKPTHVGLNPEDVRKIRAWQGEHWDGRIFYHAKANARYIIIYSDEGVEEGFANVVNHQAAFVAGYTDDPGIGESV